MKEIFLKYAQSGAMTIDELAAVLRRKTSWVRNNSGKGKLIPRVPGRPIRFDPEVMISIFCQTVEPKKARSLTTERHKTLTKPEGGYRRCL